MNSSPHRVILLEHLSIREFNLGESNGDREDTAAPGEERGKMESVKGLHLMGLKRFHFWRIFSNLDCDFRHVDDDPAAAAEKGIKKGRIRIERRRKKKRRRKTMELS